MNKENVRKTDHDFNKNLTKDTKTKQEVSLKHNFCDNVDI